MTTPDFEDWLARQEIPIEETTDVDKYQRYLTDEFGVHGDSLTVAAGAYRERYEGLEQYGVRPVQRRYTYRGEPFVETRYAIAGRPGLWGKERAYEFAADRAETAADWEIAGVLNERLRKMAESP